VKFNEVVARTVGLGCPIFDLTWFPEETDIAVAGDVIHFLEREWVLYGPSESEQPDHCVESALKIGGYLHRTIAGLEGDTELRASLRAMRAACAKFLTTVEHTTGKIVPFAAQTNHYASWVFNAALGELRGVFGVHIARVAALHGLDVEDALASILPGKEPEDRRLRVRK
jgi:hypothetical protein